MRPLLRWSVLGLGGAVWVAAVTLLALGVVALVGGWLLGLVGHPFILLGVLGVLLLGLLTSR